MSTLDYDLDEDWDEEDDECQVCGVPLGTGACPKCIIVCAELMDAEDLLDEL